MDVVPLGMVIVEHVNNVSSLIGKYTGMNQIGIGIGIVRAVKASKVVQGLSVGSLNTVENLHGSRMRDFSRLLCPLSAKVSFIYTSVSPDLSLTLDS